MEMRLHDMESQVKTSLCVDKNMLKGRDESRNHTKTSTKKVELDKKNKLLVNPPSEQVNMRKNDDLKLLMDNNENSLSVDTLIEILSSNEMNNKSLEKTLNTVTLSTSKEKGSVCAPRSSDVFEPPTLNSPQSGSSKGPTSPGPSPKTSGVISAKKNPSPHHANGGKPMISDMNKKMKQVAKRQPRTVYQSQISDNSLGIKICIKKSTDSKKLKPSLNCKSPRKRSRKTKTKNQESDSDDSYVKRRKKLVENNNNNDNDALKTPLSEPIEQSGWGKTLPKEILFEVS